MTSSYLRGNTMVKKLIAFSLLAVSFSALSKIEGQNPDLFEKTYREGKAKVTKALKKENAEELVKATAYGLLAAAGAHFSIKNLIAFYNTPKNVFSQKVEGQGRWNAFKITGINRAQAMLSIAGAFAVTAYATYKASEKTFDHLQKTQK